MIDLPQQAPHSELHISIDTLELSFGDFYWVSHWTTTTPWSFRWYQISRDERERETFIHFVAFSHTHPFQATKATQTLFSVDNFLLQTFTNRIPTFRRMKKKNKRKFVEDTESILKANVIEKLNKKREIEQSNCCSAWNGGRVKWSLASTRVKTLNCGAGSEGISNGIKTVEAINEMLELLCFCMVTAKAASTATHKICDDKKCCSNIETKCCCFTSRIARHFRGIDSARHSRENFGTEILISSKLVSIKLPAEVSRGFLEEIFSWLTSGREVGKQSRAKKGNGTGKISATDVLHECIAMWTRKMCKRNGSRGWFVNDIWKAISRLKTNKSLVGKVFNRREQV